MDDSFTSLFRSLIPAVDYCSVRRVDSYGQNLRVRQDITEPLENRYSRGAQITVFNGGGTGYAATSDLSRSGLKSAIETALNWAEFTANQPSIPACIPEKRFDSQFYRSTTEQPWDSQSSQEKLEILQDISRDLKIHKSIMDWWATLYYKRSDILFVTAEIENSQHIESLMPFMGAVASNGCEAQKRTFGGESAAQGGLEHLERIGFRNRAGLVAENALALLNAPNCPAGSADLLLMPDQVIFQIHESIGHPLELDRILGDERNYAGSSFVTKEMFGHYQYGSKLLNITFDPTRENQISRYRFDDDGESSERVFLIRDGILERPIGGFSSQQRTGVSGVAASRASDWNRAPIDRMANINLEPGDSSFESMVASIENGILMETNRSWSIDDCRRKFQFGCEIGWHIKNGEIQNMVKNPNYRGISGTFWRSLRAVGDEQTFEVLSVPSCGKGEPNQAVQVGHASPVCLFENVDIFGSGG